MSSLYTCSRVLLIYFLFHPGFLHAQVCGTPGIDGPANITTVVNTYFPVDMNVTAPAGSTSIQLLAVPPVDPHGNSFGTVPVAPGDLLLFIQIQDGTINIGNTNLYGSNDAGAGPDGLGGTGVTSIGNAGLYEYAIASNNVPLTGGVLHFHAAGTGGGLVNNYSNHPGDGTTTGKKTFQVLRVPQYSSLILSQDIICPPFNGSVGGIIAFDVAGDFNFNNYTIDASVKGFRGGFQYVQNSGCSNSLTYATPYGVSASVKGEGIAGTPRFMWDGYNEVDNGNSWLGFPGSYYGKGAPGNAGGGGNDHNAGGGGGGNGGAGGNGGNGSSCCGNCSGDSGYPNGGRPGDKFSAQRLDRLFMGGGGGGGDANNALNGTKGGVGGGIILINAGRITGNGTLLSNGGDGQRGVFSAHPDGAGGGGAGGSIKINVTNNSVNAQLVIKANGGKGGNTVNDLNGAHGPGGGGGGGVIWQNIPGAVVVPENNAGLNGFTNDGHPGAISQGANSGKNGVTNSFTKNDLPAYLQGQGSVCFPELSVVKSELHPGLAGARPPGNEAVYSITLSNANTGGGAGGVAINDALANGFTFDSAVVTYSGGATGPAVLKNTGSVSSPVLSAFTIPAGGSVFIKMYVLITSAVPPGIYHNGVQVLYLDPTRTLANPSRLVTPFIHAVTGQNTTYESSINSGVYIPGSNYDGKPSGPDQEDVHVIALGTIPPVFETCEGNTMQLTVDPPALTPPFTYAWTGPANFNPGNNVRDPVINDARLSHSGNYSVLIKDANGFTSTYTTTVSVTTASKPYLGPDTSLCAGTRFVLHSSVTGTAYQWQDGSSDDSFVVTGPGQYWVKVTQGACTTSDTILITYFNDPAVISLGPDTALCFNNFPVPVGSGINGAVYQWQDGTNNASFLVTQPGTYWRQVTVNGCSAADTIEIKENSLPFVQVQPSQQVTVCNGTSTTLQAKGALTYIWSNGSTGDVVPVSDSGWIKVTGTDGNGCRNTDSVHIRWGSRQVKASPDTLLCKPGSLQLYAEGGEKFSWSPAALFADPLATNPILQADTTTQIILTVLEDASGCNTGKKDTLVVTVLPPVAAYAGRDTTVLAGTTLVLQGSGGIKYWWQPSTGLSNPDSPNPTATVDQDITYTVRVTTLNGCTGSDTIHIKATMTGFNIFVPTAFTPDQDGLNDRFRPVLFGYKLQSFIIYNRHGQKVFETTEAGKGWDGKVGGELQSNNVFAWLLVARTPAGIEVKRKGTVALIR